MIVLLLIGVLLLGAAIVLTLRAFVGANGRASERLAQIGSYGFAADPMVAVGVRKPDVGPREGLADRIGSAFAKRFGRVRENEMRKELMAAGMYSTSPRTLLGYRVIAAAGAGAATIALAATSEQKALFVLLTVMAVVVGWLGPLAYVRRRADQRKREIDHELPELIDLLVVTVEAGLSFAASLRFAARELTGPLATELRLTLQEQSMGLALNEALVKMLERVDTPAMRSLVRSVVQGETLGVSTGTIMRNLGVEMRKRRRQAAEERAQKAPVKLLFPLVFLIFPAIFIVVLGPALFKIDELFI